ncbi:TIGR03790 family protein [Kiritimatiellota bacterium B12222]|nr:TIGR03790 family protein [Kiritimatiellota bacterium B12222]
MNYLRSLLLCLLSFRLCAQMPSECLLIINGRSLQAMETAQSYAALRNFPAERILVLEPEISFFRKENGMPRWTVDEASFRSQLLEPVLEKLDALNDSSPTALILSPEWPTRVSGANRPEVSSTGFLSCRGNLPGGNLIKQGRAISPWFAAPPDTAQKMVGLMRYPLAKPMDPAFHPAAMLGVYYPPETTEKMQQQLKTAVQADYSMPVGSIVFETNNNVRSKTRLHQYLMAENRLEAKGIDVEMVTAQGPLPSKIIGVMGGAASFNTARYKKALQPGAFADHLTSFAATFDVSSQTKLTQWLDAGAAASAGTVTEPYSIWMKFPEAAVFERYLRGNSLLEALMQSIASPFQVLIVGDPLCRPWAAELPELTLETTWENQQLQIDVSGIPTGRSTTLHLFADGQRVPGNGPHWTLNTDAENTGPEIDLQLHARYLWAPPQLGTLREHISTPYPSALTLKGSVKSDRVRLKLKSPSPLMMVDVYRGLDKIHSQSVKGKSPDIELGLNQTGTGPIQVRVKAVDATGKMSWSNYLDLSPKAP